VRIRSDGRLLTLVRVRLADINTGVYINHVGSDLADLDKEILDLSETINFQFPSFQTLLL